MTPSEIKKNDNFAIGFEPKDYNVELYLSFHRSTHMAYHFFLGGKLLFSGTDYRPSPLHSWDGIESVVNLLAFLTCQPGDTDDSYFSDYTADQLEFAKSFLAEELKGLVYDFDSSEPEYKENARKFFEDACQVQVS